MAGGGNWSRGSAIWPGVKLHLARAGSVGAPVLVLHHDNRHPDHSKFYDELAGPPPLRRRAVSRTIPGNCKSERPPMAAARADVAVIYQKAGCPARVERASLIGGLALVAAGSRVRWRRWLPASSTTVARAVRSAWG